jgi:hypothetical protein
MSLGVNQFSGPLLALGRQSRSMEQLGDEIRCAGEIVWSPADIPRVTEVIGF